MKRLSWAPAARRDLEAIEAYIAAHDPRVARAIARRIEQRAKFLREFAFAGVPLLGELRKLSVGRHPYVLLYRIEGVAVEIVAVRHTAQDWTPR